MIALASASIHVEAPPTTVFELFTTEAGLCRWMAREATVDLRPGGRWRWVHGDGMVAAGEYLEVEPPDRVRFTYGWETGRFADMAPGSTTVEVTFVPTPSGTEVRVEHAAVPDGFREAHVGGWNHFLGVLADVAVGHPAPRIRRPGSAG